MFDAGMTIATAFGAGAPQAASPLGDQISGSLVDSVLFGWLPDWAQNALAFLANYPLLLIVLLVGAGYLVGKLCQFLLTQVLSRLANRTSTALDDQLINVARRPALTVPVLLSLLLVTALLPLPGGVQRITIGALATILVLSLLRAALKVSRVLLDLLATQQDRYEMIQARTLPIFDITTKVLLVAVAGYMLLMIWGINPAAWLASAGVIGIAVGFAARDTLANLFSGIFIVADAPYKMGDYIVLGTGERGEVTHVGMRSTRLLTRDDVEITIPNAVIANAKIINESGGPWEKYRIRIPVGVAYGSDLDQVVELLMSVARDNAEVLDSPAPRVRMRGFGDSSINFELMGWIERPVLRGRVTHELFMAVYRRFMESGVEIPFPQRDLHVRSMPRQD